MNGAVERLRRALSRRGVTTTRGSYHAPRGEVDVGGDGFDASCGWDGSDLLPSVPPMDGYKIVVVTPTGMQSRSVYVEAGQGVTERAADFIATTLRELAPEVFETPRRGRGVPAAARPWHDLVLDVLHRCGIATPDKLTLAEARSLVQRVPR